jgi:hypothetical protein
MYHYKLPGGRRVALSLIDKKWYSPFAREKEEDDAAQVENSKKHVSKCESKFEFEKETSLQKPSLEKVWAYFEHDSLYRYIVDYRGEANSEETEFAHACDPKVSKRRQQIGKVGAR